MKESRIEKEKLEQERRELNALINKGVSFDIERFVYVRKPGLLGWLRGREKRPERVRFKIQEPTLAVLDLLSAEQIDLVIDENVMTSQDFLSTARKLTKAHAKRLAKIVALSVLGEDYIKATQSGARIKYEHDEEKLEELTDLFFTHVKPSMLNQLVSMISAMSNLGDFMNSIRSMSGNRTTMPIRIEENKEV